MDSQQIKRLLDEVAHEEIPQAMNLLPNFTFIPAASRKAHPARTLAKVAVLVLAMLMAAAVGYALYQEITGDPGLTAVEQDKLITRFDETRPVTGFPAADDHHAQVTLDYAYADANRITVAYTVVGDSDQPFALYMNPTLTNTDGGQFIRMVLGNYGSPLTGEDASGRKTYTTSMISSFDATGITGTPEALNLSLKVEVAAAYPESDEPMTMLLLGDATFEFTVQFVPGRQLDEAQTATASDLSMTLKTVVVAPSLTRLEMCYADPAPEGRAWALDGQLEVDGKRVVESVQLNETGPNGESLDESAPCHTLIIPARLDNHPGEWTLTITDLRLPGSEDPAQAIAEMHQRGFEIEASEWGGYSETDAEGTEALKAVLGELQQRIDGPWVFTFILPE